ncbi:MAG: sugar phosphate nucleotidyltransferase [Verrucomicrobiota bacterium]|nr:sugar phosphate nucleotidyltransferase [Verrucomicrobiota bacterium]
MITQAFVLGAGLGTRLRPLTDELPKPLVPIFQKPLITFALDHLLAAGVENFHVNTHHRPEKFAEAFPSSHYRRHRLQFHHEPVLLETAGGIANIAASLRDEPLLVYNADILCDLPLAPLLAAHERDANLVTLALRRADGPRHIAFDQATRSVVDIRDQLGTGKPTDFTFTGVYIVSVAFVRQLAPGVKRSVIPHFLEAIKRGERIGGVVIDDGNWWDVGTIEAYRELHRCLPSLKFPSFPVDDPDWRIPVHPDARIIDSALIEGGSVIGRDATIAAGARLRDTIVWPHAQIASRAELTGCIVRSHQTAAGSHHDAII